MLETEIKNLTAAITALTNRLGSVGTELPVATAPAATAPAAAAPAAAAPAAAAPAAAAPAAAAPAAAAPAAAATTSALTIDEVRKTLGTVIETHGPECVPQALTAFGVSKLSDLPAESYVALLNQVSQIVGAKVG